MAGVVVSLFGGGRDFRNRNRVLVYGLRLWAAHCNGGVPVIIAIVTIVAWVSGFAFGYSRRSFR